jgi:hypothetical protein
MMMLIVIMMIYLTSTSAPKDTGPRQLHSGKALSTHHLSCRGMKYRHPPARRFKHANLVVSSNAPIALLLPSSTMSGR